jgi:hypothetical protein
MMPGAPAFSSEIDEKPRTSAFSATNPLQAAIWV